MQTQMLRATQEQEWWADQVVHVYLFFHLTDVVQMRADEELYEKLLEVVSELQRVLGERDGNDEFPLSSLRRNDTIGPEARRVPTSLRP